MKSSIDPASKPEHKKCDRCLEPEYACACLPTNLENYEAPGVVWVASRPVQQPSAIRRDGKYRYARACEEVDRLNRVYKDKVIHFLLPVD